MLVPLLQQAPIHQISDSVRAGGSVLIPMNRLGIVLQLLEQISVFLESSSLKVPIYIISSIAEELLSFTNIIPEWLCEQRQEKLFSGEPLFAHVKLVREGKILVFPAVHSPKLLSNWQEPCIVFAPHYSLRLGPIVHLLRRWCGDQKSLLVLESGVDADIAFLPFKPMAMNVLQCSFLSGIPLQKIQPLLKMLQPKLVMFPKDLKICYSSTSSFSVFHYSDKETLRIPRLKDILEVQIATKASQLKWRKLKQENMKITRLEGELFMNHCRYQLFPGKKLAGSKQRRPLLHWGSPNMERLLTVLSEMGIICSREEGMSDGESENVSIVHVHNPNKALIEVRATSTVITSANEELASLIFEAIDSILDGI